MCKAIREREIKHVLELFSILIIFTTTLLTNTNQSSYFAQELDKKQQIQMLQLLNSFYIL
jgi:hypothetical protein